MIRACIEQQSLRYYIEEAKRQNKEYFEMKARDLISKEKDDMVAAVQANLLFQSLNMTREEILDKYPTNQHNKTETMDEDQCTVDDKSHVNLWGRFTSSHRLSTSRCLWNYSKYRHITHHSLSRLLSSPSKCSPSRRS